MGKRVIAGICALSIASATIMVVGGFWAQHSVTFNTLIGVRVLKVETTLLTTYIDRGDICRILESAKPGFCDSITGHQDLMDVSQRFCAPAIEAVYPQACSGFFWAYVMGIAVVVDMLVSLVLQAIACWMLFQYGWQSAKRQYRRGATGLIAASACIFAIALLAYGLVALLQLSNLEPRGSVFSFALAPDRGIGVARGYMLQWVACLLQVVMVALLPLVEVSDEANVEEAKLLKKALVEEGLGNAMPQQGYGSGMPQQGYGNGMPQQGYGSATMIAGGGPPQPGYGGAGAFMQPAPQPMPTFTGGGGDFGLQGPAPQLAQPQAMPHAGQPQAMHAAW